MSRGGPGKKRKRLTAEDMRVCAAYIAAGGGVEMAAKYIGVTGRAIRKAKVASRAWREAIDAAMSLRRDRVVRALYDRAIRNDTIAGIFLLKNWDPQGYRDRREVHVTKGFEELLEESFAETDDKQPTSDAPAQAGSEPTSGAVH